MSSQVFHFDLILTDCDDVVDDMTQERFMAMSEALFEAGCDDGTYGVSCGIVHIAFAREANTLREAIKSAIADVERAGYKVAEVRPEDHQVYEEVNHELAAT
jgi:hypothetical protein